LSAKTLEDTKLTKALGVFAKRGNDEVKGLIKVINQNASIPDADGNSKQSSADSPRANAVKSTISSVLPTNAANAKDATQQLATKISDSKVKVEAASESKRPRSGAEILGPPAKRQLVSSISVKPQPTSATTTVKKPVATVGSKTSATAQQTSSAGTKPKTAAVGAQSKASSFFSSMQAATKKPQSTADSNSSVPATSAAKGSFSFANILDGLASKPTTTETKVKPTETKTLESEEAKLKRLRKESRKKLRVTWKPDHELVATKFFTHDPDEDTGHDASSVRDAGDILNEGKAFKERLKHQELDDDMDEEPETDQYTVQVFGNESSISLAEIDPEPIPESDRDRNYLRFLGPKLPDSPASAIERERENTTLMAFYEKRSDIPPRPASPVNPYPGQAVQPINIGMPGESSRAYMMTNPTPIQPYVPPMDITSLLKSLAPTAPTVAQPPAAVQAQSQPTGNDVSWLENIFAQHSNKSTSTPAVPNYIPPAVQQPYSLPVQQPPNPLLAALGLPPAASQPQPAAAANNDLGALLARLSAHNNPTPPQQQQPFIPLPAAAPAADPASLLAQLSWLYGAQQQPPNANMNQQTDQYQGVGAFEHPDRKRAREVGEDDGRNDTYKRPNTNSVGQSGANGANWNGANGKPKFEKNDFLDQKKFTLPCRFWPEGKCRKGTDCTYRHDPLN
jgi:hypothetical protein